VSSPTLARTASNEVVNWLARSRTRNWKVAARSSRSFLVTKDEQFDVLGRQCPAEQCERVEKSTDDQIEQA
jgi:hypothetical protein